MDDTIRQKSLAEAATSDALSRDPGGLVWWKWWPLLIPIVAIAMVYAAHAAGPPWSKMESKPVQEVAGVAIPAVALALALIRLQMQRDRFGVVVAALCFTFLCREIHFAGTHRGVYVAVGLIAMLCAVWRKHLWPTVWLTARGRWVMYMMWAYLVPLLVQRRALRGVLPLENELHIQLEEVGENVAHIFLCLLALV